MPASVDSVIATERFPSAECPEMSAVQLCLRTGKQESSPTQNFGRRE
jgi:hypothetical protein